MLQTVDQAVFQQAKAQVMNQDLIIADNVLISGATDSITL